LRFCYNRVGVVLLNLYLFQLYIDRHLRFCYNRVGVVLLNLYLFQLYIDRQLTQDGSSIGPDINFHVGSLGIQH
jgi:hypothetical protein